MKKLLLTIPALGLYFAAQAQNVGVGTTNPDPSAMLDVRAVDKGMLMPRIQLTGITDALTIAAPATGLTVFNTNAALPSGTGIYINTGTTTAPMWAKLPTVYSAAAPTTGQVLVWNGTSYVPGSLPTQVTNTGTGLSGNGTPGNPVIFNGIATNNPVFGGNGTSIAPLTINTASPVYNANQINNSAVSNTAPTANQVLVWDAAANQYKPAPVNAVLIQNKNISGTAPTNGQVLVFNTTTNQWEPSTQADTWGSQSVTNAGGSVLTGNGTAANPLNVNTASPVYNANKINNTTVSGTAPTANQTLVFNTTTSQWEPKTVADTWGSQSVTNAGGSVLTGNGTAANPLNVNTASPVYNANKINNSAVSSTAPTANQVLVWDATTSQYKPAPVNAVLIQNKTISGTAPTNGQVLVFNTTNNQWEPSTQADTWGGQSVVNAGGSVLTGNGTAANPLNVNTASPVYNANKINNTTVSGTAPNSGQTLVFNTTTNQWEPSTQADTWGTQTVVNAGGSVLTGNGTSTSPLNVNTASPVYNANKINNSAVSGTAPTANQVLVWDATTSQYKPAPVNAVLIQNKTISGTAPTNGQVLVFNTTNNQWEPSTQADTWGTQTVVNAGGSVLTGNGTSTSPLNVNTASPVYNANKINNTTVSGTVPTANQILVFNTTTSQWEPKTVADTWGTQSVVNAGGSVLSGTGTSGSPLNVNTASPVYNANKINSIAVTGAPVNGQVLVYNGTGYVPMNAALSASNGLTMTGTEVKFGGALTSNTTVNTGSNTLAVAGTALTTTFDNQGEIGIGVSSPSNALHVNATNPLRLQGVQDGTGSLMVIDGNGVVKKMAGSLTFNFSKISDNGMAISQNNETGAVPYNQASVTNGSILGGGSWTAIPGLSKTINITSASNAVGFSTEGVVEYNGVLSTSGWVSYSIAIFVDGKLQATRNFTMTGSGGVDQFDTYQVAGQLENMSVGAHTISVYGTRRNSPNNSNDELYFCAPAPNYGNTNAFMNRGVLFVNGSY